MLSKHTISRREFTQLATALPFVGAQLLRGESTRLNTGRRPSLRWDGYEDAIVIDCLASPGPFNVPNREGNPLAQEMVENAKASGITAVNLTLNASGQGHESFDNAVKSIAYWERELTAHGDVFMKIHSMSDLMRAKESKRFGIIFGFQDSKMLEGELDRLETFHRFGVRIIQLTYNLRNLAGDGCLEAGNAGLSRFGHALIERMNDLGMVVDLSHCGQRTTADAIAASRHPVSATHSGCRAVFDHPRSKRDEELKQMADKGGIIGIYLMPFLNPSGPASADHLIQHIDHAVNICGEDHVGIGSDQSTTPIEADDDYRAQIERFAVERQQLGIAAPRENELLFIPDLNTPRRMETIADRLLSRGHSEARVEKIVGGNFARLFREVWR